MGDSLWNSAVGPSSGGTATGGYEKAVLEQYKLCVEMADRVSARRNLTNTFFLTFNSAVVTALAATSGAAWRHGSVGPLLAALVILLTQCLAWLVMMRSYRQLNGAKYTVINALELRLPARAFTGEWDALRAGTVWRRYLPLTYVEQSIPAIFAAAYLVGFFAAVL
ncbi:RipA family octameric membrane protein [Streptacidiphilus cavernicola]|uniref:Small integral membrane protein n=1 Tax=Streptacidiphilus cavernicola TaxID=3342716 RepID=A0ABV6VS90_9ACTN